MFGSYQNNEQRLWVIETMEENSKGRAHTPTSHTHTRGVLGMLNYTNPCGEFLVKTKTECMDGKMELFLIRANANVLLSIYLSFDSKVKHISKMDIG